jgi:hypothetical protein
METRKLHNKRYISLLRCSSPGQIDTSIDDQRRVLDAFALEQGMVHVDEVILPGVSGSMPANRDDIPKLIARKRQQDDFDILLVQDTSRFTRSGPKHVHHLEYELNAEGIDVVYATGSITDDWTGEVQKTLLASADEQHVRTISFTSARGSMSSILDNRSPYCRRPPYGIDRLYVSPEGTELHIIRNVSDGRQQMLNPKTMAVIREFCPNQKSGAPNHHVKQKQDRVVLMPGDQKCIEVVRRIFRRSCVDNWGAYRIASELNTEGIPSPTGKKWTTHTVGAILRNPIYTGRGIANRYSVAIYNMRGPNHPVKVQRSNQERYGHKRPSRHIRPESDWHVQEHPQLRNILDPEVRAIAEVRQQKHLDRQASGHKPKPDRDRHRDSRYILKGLLRCAQGDLPMTGITTGKKGHRKRYYRLGRAFAAPDNDAVLRKMVPADPLEEIVLETVRTVLLALPDLRDRIERQVRTVLQERHRDHDELQGLLKQREDLRKRLEWVIDDFDADMKDLAEGKIAELKAQLRSVSDRIGRCEQVTPMSDGAVQEVVDATLTAVRHLAETMRDAPPATLRQYLQVLVRRLVVDLESRETVLEIALPDTVDMKQIEVCLVEGFACKSYNQTHPLPGSAIAVYRLVWDRKAYAFHPVQVDDVSENVAA